MEQHPVPQQISSYQFRLVGDMTLKQFFELAGGALIGLLFYASSIPALFKWPLIIIFFLAGAALAFLPFEDRPLEVWVIAFLRSIYSPTLYYWSKTTVKPKYFQDESVNAPNIGVVAPGGEAKLNKYLSEAASQGASYSAGLEEKEKGFLTKVTGIFGQFIPGSATLTTREAKIEPQPAIYAETVEVPLAGTSQPQTQKPLTIPQTEPISTSDPQKRMTVRVFEQEEPKTQETPVPVAPIPQTPQVPTTPPPAPPQQAQFSAAASPPMPPAHPNTLSGQVLDNSGRIIEGAILEIKDAAGRPVRAVKTNKLGHFFIVTPLSDGTYEILTEKDGYDFATVTFKAEGTIIPSIAIRANKALPN